MNWNFVKLRSLKSRLILFTLTIILVSIWSLAWYTSRMLREDMQRVLGDQQASTVSFIAKEINSEVLDRLGALEKVAAKTRPATLGNPRTLQAFLEDQLILQGTFNGDIVATDAEGTAIAEIPRGTGILGINLMDRDHVAYAIREGKAAIGRPVLGKKTQAPIVVMTVPIRGPQEKVIGTLSGITDLSKHNFLDMITEGRYGKTGGYVLVAPQYRQIVTATDKRLATKSMPASGSEAWIDRFIQGYEGTGIFQSAGGDEILTSAQKVAATGWYVAVELPTKEAFAPITAMQQRTLLIAVFLTLLAGGLTWWMLTRQLSPVVETAKRISALPDSMQPPLPLPIVRDDEIGELIGGFNRLLDTLGAREGALRDSEARYRSLLEWSTEAIFVHRGGKILYVNQAAIRLFGANSAQELLGKSTLDRIHPDYRAALLARRESLTVQGTSAPLKLMKYLKLDGTAIDVESQGTLIVFDGEPAIYTAARDITERKLVDELNARLAAIVEHSNDAIVSISLDRKILSWNSGAQRMFGYGAAEVMGLNIVDLIVPNDRESEVPKIRQQFDSGRSILDFETVRMTKDGGTIDVSLSQSPSTDEQGNILSISLIFRDIRERKHAEAALRQSEAHNRRLLDVSPDGIWIHSQGTIHYVNEALMKMLGYSRAEELQGRSIYEFFPPQERSALQTRVKSTAANAIPVTTITSRLRHDGTLVPVEVTAAAYVQDGKSWNIAIARDISERNRAETERTELESQLRESQKMEALGTLAGGVAHDFNNALASILGNVELARQDVGPGHVALVSLEEIGKAGRRAKDLVQQILTFGRRQTLERQSTSLALVVVESARFLRATLPAKVRLIVDCKPEAPAVLADATQIKQILINLYNNALQAVEDQEAPGLIEILLHAHTQFETRGELSVGRYACLTVRDNGRGMDETTRSHIFEPFFTTKPRGKGTGLGLSVVHGIVQTHLASIEVESSPGQGSTFRIYFPASEIASQAVDVPALPSPPLQVQGRHVLYLDDEEAIIFLMTRLLERKGFRVSGYTDQREALDAVRANPGEFDLAVTDYNMPGMSGLDVAQELKEIRPDLPVVLASGYITEELRAQAPRVGIRELIYKPNTVDDLCDAVVRLAKSFRDKSTPTG